jgi:hypothetical protein
MVVHEDNLYIPNVKEPSAPSPGKKNKLIKKGTKNENFQVPVKEYSSNSPEIVYSSALPSNDDIIG